MNRPVSSAPSKSSALSGLSPCLSQGLSWGRSLWQWPWLRWLLVGLWLLLLGGIAFLWQLGSIGLVDETEPLFAEAARQMTVTGDWITPYFNGETRFDKPPLIYWLMAIAYQTIGVNEWAARLPSALSAIALTAFVFYVLQQFGTLQQFGVLQPLDTNCPTDRPNRHWLPAWIGSGACALNLQMMLWGRSGVSDMLLTACMGGALLAFFCGYVNPQRPQLQRRWYLGFYVLAALAVLTKGPVGIVLPGMIVVAFLLYMGNIGTVLRELQLVWGSVIFLLMTVPWYVLVTLAHGKTYLDDFFGYHNVERFTSVVNNHSAPWFFYFLVVLLGFIPWSIYVPVAIARLTLWQRSRWQQSPRQTHLGLFAAIWFLVIFIFFTIATTKLPSYTIPLLPAASILVALVLSETPDGSMTHTLSQPSLRPTDTLRENQGEGVPEISPLTKGGLRGVSARSQRTQFPGLLISHIVNALFLAILAGAVVYSGNWLGDDPVMPDFPQLVQQSGVLIWGGLSWGFGAIAALALILKKATRWTWSVNLIAFTAFVLITLLPLLPLMDSQRQLPLRQIAKTIEQSATEPTEVVMIGFKKPTLVFYTQRPVTYIYGLKEAIAHLKAQGKIRPITAPHNRSSKDVFLVGRSDELVAMPLPEQKYEQLQEAGLYQLLHLHLNLKI